MDTALASSYDEIPYGDNCFSATHPDYLATLAGLHGLEPPSVEQCRVLELGCAGGGNIIPMALENPRAQFVGVDLSHRQIAAGQALVDELGLRNIVLRALDLTQLGPDFGTFDYIVCHGVFSWVPAAVRDVILAICRDRLAPSGVAYVSYNTYPGWHARGLVRELMSYHVRQSASPLERVERARGFLDQLVQVLPDKSNSYARILRTEGEFLRGVANSYLFHEHLEETNHPLYFHEFMAQAAANGLQFVAEAHAPGLMTGLPADARAALDGWASDELAAEQYLDFLLNRTFRRTLLGHAGQPRSRTPLPDRVPALWVATHMAPVSSTPDTRSDAAEEFRRPEDESSITTNNPVIKTALVELYRLRPSALAFPDLCQRVSAELGVAPATERESLHAALQESLLRCFLWNLVALHTCPPRFAVAVSERPIASPLARIQARSGERVTTLRRRTAVVADFDRFLLTLLDGTRDRGALLAALQSLAASGEFSIYHQDEPVTDTSVIREVLEAEIEPALERMSLMALLTG